MAAPRGTKRGRQVDVNTEEKRERHSAPKNAAGNFVFVTCTDVKEEPKGAVDKEVATSEEISFPDCDMNIKEEVNETVPLAAAPVPERDPLQIEEKQVAAAAGHAPHSERFMEKTSPGCNIPAATTIRRTRVRGQLWTNSATSRKSANRGRRLEGCSQKPTNGTCDSWSLGGSGRDVFTCDTCQKAFPSKQALLTHVFIHIDAEGLPLHICRLCGDVFPTQRCLQMHCLQIHLNNQHIVAKKGNILLDTNKKQGNYRKPQTEQCSSVKAGRRQKNVPLKSGGELLHQEGNDISQLTSRDSDSCQKSIAKDVTLPKRKISQSVEAPKVSHKNNTSLVSPAHMKQHAVVHSVDPPYKCSDCGKYFKYQVHLQQHANSHRKKSHVCDDCGRCFIRPVDLRQHALSHTGEKPHVCKCGKSYAKSGSLKRHEMVHRGERPFTCDVCFKTFAEAGVLKKHIVVHTGERAFKCGECGKAFKEVSHLRRHSLLHSGEKPYVCRSCGMSFNQSATLKRHIRVHTGEKPYTCDECSKPFADRRNWKMHLLVHHGDKTHKCDICEKRFVKQRDLLQHIRVHIL